MHHCCSAEQATVAILLPFTRTRYTKYRALVRPTTFTLFIVQIGYWLGYFFIRRLFLVSFSPA